MSIEVAFWGWNSPSLGSIFVWGWIKDEVTTAFTFAPEAGKQQRHGWNRHRVLQYGGAWNPKR